VALTGFAISEGESLKDVHGPYIGSCPAGGTDAHDFVVSGAESGAKRASAGLWSTTFVPPADWRHHGLGWSVNADPT
jgi:hypothetical protein